MIYADITIFCPDQVDTRYCIPADQVTHSPEQITIRQADGTREYYSGVPYRIRFHNTGEVKPR